MSPKHKLLTGNGAIRLTEGPIARQLIAFAVPLFLGSLIQQLYSTVDLMFVGKLIGRDASAAVGSSGLGLPDHLDLYVVVPVYLLQNPPLGTGKE